MACVYIRRKQKAYTEEKSKIAACKRAIQKRLNMTQ